MMVRELTASEFENNILQLQIHGIDKNTIDRIRKVFYETYPEKVNQIKEKDLPSLAELRTIGLKLSKPNKTEVKR